jgi:RNA polymerase sigma factor (sigma-70 family)
MGYPVDKKAQIHSELALLMPRLASFALALTGNEAASQALVKATRNQAQARAAKERGHTPLILWSFQLMHALWDSRMKAQTDRPGAADARLFQPRSLAQTGNPAQTARMAKFLAQLPAQQRATLHLVYGERLSYDEVADVFAVPVSAVMTRLARCHAALHQFEDYGSSAPLPAGATPRPGPEAPRSREWAA